MKIEKQIQDDHQAKLTVEFEAEEVESAKQRAARKIAGRARIPGFRPGKAPYPVIVRQYGDAAILEEAIELMIDEKYAEMLKQAEVDTYGPGRLEKMSQLDPLTLEIMVPLAAEVVLGDFRAIRKPYELPAVSEQEVAEALADLRERNAVSEPVDRPAQEGDLVTIKLDAVRVNPPEGKDPILIRERSVPILIKPEQQEESPEGKRVEWPFSGFSRRLIGLTPAAEASIDYTYPDDSSYENLRGLQASFHFVVESVKERQLPAIDDEFAASQGEYETLEALKSDIFKMLQSRKEEDYNETYDNALLEEASGQAEIKWPPQMLEHEVEDILHNLEERLGQQGMTLDLYLKSRQLDLNGLKDEIQPGAVERLKKRLVLLQIAEAENIQVERQELQEETARTMQSLAAMMDKKEARKLATETAYRNVMTNIMADLLTKRTMEHLRAISSGKLESGAQVEEEAHGEQDIPAALTSAEEQPSTGELATAREETKANSQPGVEAGP